MHIDKQALLGQLCPEVMAPRRKGQRGRGRGHPGSHHQSKHQEQNSTSSEDSDERAALEDYLENLRQGDSDAEVSKTLD
jgi:hypothetical protein